MAVIGPHIALSDLVCGGEVYRIGGTYEQIAGSGNHQSAGSPQQSFVDGNQNPQTLFYVVGEAGGKYPAIIQR